MNYEAGGLLTRKQDTMVDNREEVGVGNCRGCLSLEEFKHAI